ncbi:M15 family metallopeptidase [Actinotalea fermentans]|uniref:Peptidase M15C domain-containing protein n=1 Tax=Actinotalea fermentans TaxID=43671 RepID=A0A511YSX4_9CELL|nr:M15 family metallopeptidase [Actinotalea fermentans]KGM16988.1 extensin family protein [Actinotalea fermentans ATCC 43279 = JCM 9966 = DSM 3133]GEN78297.1 hypothetical protein AFE02nite_00310 [Actinotalea fermentans]
MTRGRAAAIALLLAPVVVLAAACGGAGLPEPDVVEVAAAVPVTRALPPARPAEAGPMYASSIATIDDALTARMSASWRPGCPVPLEDLRYVTVTHVDFDGVVRTGELVVHADVAEAVTRVFAALFEQRYPVRSMRLVDDFGADDTASIYADNTSAFNCRAITGGTAWSEHAYGRAIDLNPVENPYVTGSHVGPRTGRAFASRPDEPGVIHADDAVVAAFAAEGWQWGGLWPGPIDYQHFSTSGR